MSDNDAVLLEDMNHKFDVILEYLAPLARVPRKLDEIDNRLIAVESDVKVIKLVLKGHSKDIGELKTDVRELKMDMKSVKALATNHERRVTTLERGA